MENADEALENAIVEANLENDEQGHDHMLFAADLYRFCAAGLYFLYPILLATTKVLLFIRIPHFIGYGLVLVLFYPLYRIIPTIVVVERRWRGWMPELTHFWGWPYELYVLHVYSLFCLLMFLNLSFSTALISLDCIGLLYELLMVDLAQRPFSIRLKSTIVKLIGVFSFFWWHDALAEGTAYELRKFSLTRCLGWLFFFICSINTAQPVLARLL